MTSDYHFDAAPDFQSDFAHDAGLEAAHETPSHIEVRQDTGREVLVIGDVEGDKAFNHVQGDNPYGMKGDCGLVSAQDILAQHGIFKTETEVTRFAVQEGVCTVSAASPEHSGTSTPEQLAKLLTDEGVPADAVENRSLNDLAGWVETGHGVIIGVNAGDLWNDARYHEQGQANHAIVVTGVALDPQTGAVEGYYVNDSGSGDSGRFVTADLMQKMWVGTGSCGVVTQSTHA